MANLTGGSGTVEGKSFGFRMAREQTGWRNFVGFQTYRKFSYIALWNKRLIIMKSYKIPMEWLNP